ncbi:MAG TPA: SGNH/GDSL hydrolase family protein [Gemmatimonadales bacterium]|nr:SGNH/GDSL hydrolase family protein [Gemmatimonadales bacterium]
MRIHRFALAALAVPLVAACSSLVDNQKMGPLGTPSGGAMFANYVALGTSISAGVQSGGISDSTQRRAYPYLLAQAMGLSPNANWFYPGFTAPGCPPPYTNPLTGARVDSGTATTCNLISPLSVPARQNYYNNLGVPSMRVGQALHISSLLVPATDTLLAAQFITGSRNPVDILDEAKPTFVTVELGANDALHAATSGDTTVMTPLALFQAQYDSLAARLVATGAKVALANIPNVANIPFITRGVVFFCLKTGACPGVPATAPFNLATFTVDLSCAPSASGGVGDKMAIGLPGTATIAGTLQAGGAASLNCGTGVATTTTLAGTNPTGPVVTVAALAAISARVTAFNAKIASVATAHGWALANLDSALTILVAADSIPPIPNLATPSKLFGSFVSLDGFHPATAGQKLIADLFVVAIDSKYGTTLTPP